MGAVEEYIRDLKASAPYGQIAHVEEIDEREPSFDDVSHALHPRLRGYLDSHKIRLYSHQARAIDLALDGKNVIITTPTASGKTLAFNVPVFEALLNDKKATALYLYPMKALSNDQLKTLKSMDLELGTKAMPSIYDGDTPQSARPGIRDTARIIVSNPYAIHRYLPWHDRWRRLFSGLRFVVIDEAHTYRGIYGSGVAMLIRRLRRILKRYGSDPQFILSSATVANPEELSFKLTGKQFEVVSKDGSGRGKKYFMFWNPPIEGESRGSTHQETMRLLVSQLDHGLQTICFTPSRRMAELIGKWAREYDNGRFRDVIASYRAGYLPEDRRRIEDDLKNRRLMGVTSTNALEVGIDIGSLDSVIISGYPGTRISTWQQAGRAGRGMSESLVTLVAFDNPLDQYYMKHPDRFFHSKNEEAIVDLRNPYILMGHLMCASAELPLTSDDSAYFGDFSEALEALSSASILRRTPRGFVYGGTKSPSEIVDLKNISSHTVRVMCGSELLETMEASRACSEAHNGAVLLHQGETYLIEDLDLKLGIARAVQKDVDYYTEALKLSDVAIRRERMRKTVNGIDVHVGDVTVTEQYYEYAMKRYEKLLGYFPLDLPPQTFESVALWFTLPDDLHQGMLAENRDFNGGIHAVEHAMIAMAPLFALCDRWDMGGLSTPNHPDTNLPTIFIYDAYEGGIGIAEKCYEAFPDLAKATLELVRDCECAEGCPACIYSPKCGNKNKPLDKSAAKEILGRVVQPSDG
ncbi:Distinct helicase family with a unique C-terminal domain including a metal-binding cysteine cluster [Methanocella conradii HZ254]|uniref:Distinct helicase family with a unique C-terminal domain including a metal-binding cysteine cluster n=1 Tax=Methanocella conradii (strain DSM 24694 / JCM 17849 / CGMCC 1.5162 / HZ254) TaxID=1041930 RepID=H8I7P5_METCZ|nr:DEAD/DEAH box helicase [Methanocella conradii]AFC99880.1 Distinct helicase family with a unique C-terminal domain including a metal-binding cysteine cluster [Methanocella conradii HZ254]